jgi:hypothetical protein
MEPEGSSPHSQVTATCPYPQSARSSPCPTYKFMKIHLNIILPSAPESSRSVSLSCPHQNPACTSPLPARIILLDMITRTILGEGYRSLSSSLCSFLYSPVTSFLLSPNILLILTLHYHCLLFQYHKAMSKKRVASRDTRDSS